MSDKITKTVIFKREKDTKNTVKFQEQGDLPLIGPLYVQRHALQALGNINAETIEVTLAIP